jgi:hypothetical protein
VAALSRVEADLSNGSNHLNIKSHKGSVFYEGDLKRRREKSMMCKRLISRLIPLGYAPPVGLTGRHSAAYLILSAAI